MSMLSPVAENDLIQEVEKLIIRKSRPASVSCEARTPKGNNLIMAGESSEQTDGKKSKQKDSTKTRKKGTSLTKGKMEIFQIIADPEVTANKEMNFNESFGFITPRNINGLEKDFLSTPRLDETLNESSNFDKVSNKSDTNLEILEKLNALETSLAAMAATKDRQAKQEDKLERLLRASSISYSPQTQLDLQEKWQAERRDILPQKNFLQNSPVHERLPPRQEQYLQSVPIQHAPSPSSKMADNDFAHLLYNPALNTSFQGSGGIGQYVNKSYDFNKQMNFSEPPIIESRQNLQATKPNLFSNTQMSDFGQNLFQRNQGQTVRPQSQNLNRTISSQSETQDLLYKIQQDMIMKQREIPYIKENQQNQISQRNPPMNKYMDQGVYHPHPSNIHNSTNQPYSSEFGNQAINLSELNLGNQSFVGNEMSFCDYENYSNLNQTVNQSMDSQSHFCNPMDQSFVGNINQSDLQSTQRQENHCKNCQPQQSQTRNNDLALNKLDFTKREPTTNLTLIVNGTMLYIHKEVVSAWSNRWRHLVRVNSATGDEITLKDTKLPTVLALLQYIYGIHKIVTDKNVYLLLELADKFEMPKIKVECERYLVEKDPEMKLLIVAQNFRLQQLYKKNLEFVTRQDLAIIERNALFPQLNATTTASVYRTEIVRLRNSTRAQEQERLKWQHEMKKLKRKSKDEQKKYDEILRQWKENRNRCHKHYSTELSDFVFACADCNNRVYKRVKKLCAEKDKITGNGTGDVSLLSDDISD